MKKSIFLFIFPLLLSCEKCQECTTQVITFTYDQDWVQLDQTNSETSAGEICGDDVESFIDQTSSRDTTYNQGAAVYIDTQTVPRCQ